MDAEPCEKSSGRLSFAFDDFVEIGPVVAGTLGEFSHAAHLLRHNTEKLDDLRSRETMDCDWGICHVVDGMPASGAQSTLTHPPGFFLGGPQLLSGQFSK